MQLYIHGTTTHVLECEDGDTLGALKERIAELEDLEETDVLLYAAGAPLLDACVAGYFKGSAIELNVGLLGGKVHGSLSRAGKVRSQTPKVEQQEKKKKKTGRAKKRMQYNKRIVNAPAYGPRQGPNSNQGI